MLRTRLGDMYYSASRQGGADAERFPTCSASRQGGAERFPTCSASRQGWCPELQINYKTQPSSVQRSQRNPMGVKIHDKNDSKECQIKRKSSGPRETLLSPYGSIPGNVEEWNTMVTRLLASIASSSHDTCHIRLYFPTTAYLVCCVHITCVRYGLTPAFPVGRQCHPLLSCCSDPTLALALRATCAMWAFSMLQLRSTGSEPVG